MSEADTLWPAQVEQNKAPTEISIEGVSDWKEPPFFHSETTLKTNFAEYEAGQVVPTHELLCTVSKHNNVSIERTILSEYLDYGYKIEELEVEFWDSKMKAWGQCVWYKEHPSYTKESKLFPTATPEAKSHVFSMFRTATGEDKEFSLLSTQMVTAFLLHQHDRIHRVPFLFHKAILFRRVVLSAPKPQVQAA